MSPHSRSIEPLPWDSEFFGFRIGRVYPRQFKPAELPQQARDQGYRCLYLTCGISDGGALKEAAQAGFAPLDVRVTLKARLDPDAPEPDESTAIDISPYRPEDMPHLIAIAHDLSTYSRFNLDPSFDEDAARLYYARKIQDYCAGRAEITLVARRDGVPVGLATCSSAGATSGALKMVGVRDSAAGTGIGSALVKAALHHHQQAGRPNVVVTVEGRNPRALNFYQRNRFQIREMELQFHSWIEQ